MFGPFAAFSTFSVAVAAVGSGASSAVAIANASGNTTAVQHLLDLAAFPNARCLDGTAAVMYLRPGWGSGTHVWNLFHEGGGSCHSVEDCAARAKTRQGSSAQWEKTIDIGRCASGPYFSIDPAVNPLLYNANHVCMIYCDGGAFSGDNYSTTATTTAAAAPSLASNSNPNSSSISSNADANTIHLHFRGQRIIRGIVSQLGRDTAFKEATDVIISGCSEGGVAT